MVALDVGPRRTQCFEEFLPDMRVGAVKFTRPDAKAHPGNPRAIELGRQSKECGIPIASD